MVCPRDRDDPVRVFEFMKANQASFPIARMARLLGVSRAGYYAWLGRPLSARAEEDAALLRRIRTVHATSRQTYAALTVHAALRSAGIRHGRKRIARLMRSTGLVGASHRRGGPVTTRRDDSSRPAPDLVDRNFTASGPNQLWVADITFIPTAAGFLYLAVVLDVWSRKVVGWATANHLRTELVLDALDMAVGQRRPRGVIHHSDQGSQPRLNWSSQRLPEPIAAPRQALRLAFSSRASCEACH
ncbi:IS3 family transposase [Siccirubricoccus sp. G192]|nr:IS3 family transposase [Siccirubricoccus sp. G192]